MRTVGPTHWPPSAGSRSPRPASTDRCRSSRQRGYRPLAPPAAPTTCCEEIDNPPSPSPPSPHPDHHPPGRNHPRPVVLESPHVTATLVTFADPDRAGAARPCRSGRSGWSSRSRRRRRRRHLGGERERPFALTRDHHRRCPATRPSPTTPRRSHRSNTSRPAGDVPRRWSRSAPPVPRSGGRRAAWCRDGDPSAPSCVGRTRGQPCAERERPSQRHAKSLPPLICSTTVPASERIIRHRVGPDRRVLAAILATLGRPDRARAARPPSTSDRCRSSRRRGCIARKLRRGPTTCCETSDNAAIVCNATEPTQPRPRPPTETDRSCRAADRDAGDVRGAHRAAPPPPCRSGRWGWS